MIQPGMLESNTDADRWNQRFRTAPPDWYQSPRSILTTNSSLLPLQGWALDLAMGTGQNAAFLAERGLRVVGVDISIVGAQTACKRSPEIMVVVADLNHFWLPEQRFDVILNLYYLQRSLFPLIARALKPGGLLIFEALLEEMRLAKPDLNSDHLLKSGELHQAFDNWEIIYEREGWALSDHGHQKAVASLVARRPMI